jgi:hypothetical protein
LPKKSTTLKSNFNKRQGIHPKKTMSHSHIEEKTSHNEEDSSSDNFGEESDEEAKDIVADINQIKNKENDKDKNRHKHSVVISNDYKLEALKVSPNRRTSALIASLMASPDRRLT